MRGASEFAKLFGSEQHGRLFLVSGAHARGSTFHIYVLPTDEPITGMPWQVVDAVEVYGVTGGNPGWTETYGWLHTGKWQEDFMALVKKRQNEIAEKQQKDLIKQEDAKKERIAKKLELLAKY